MTRARRPLLALALALAAAPVARAGEDAAAPAAVGTPAPLTACGLAAPVAVGAPGKVRYVDFWASWCGPCLKAFPFMAALQRDLAPRGLEVIALNLDERPADARSFLERHPAGFEVRLGDNVPCARAFGVDAMPSSFLVDRRGRVRHAQRGFRPGEAAALRALVERLLEEPAEPGDGPASKGSTP